MLTLSRSAGQTIYIGEDVVLTVGRVHRGRVQISIDAPRNLAIRRGELPRSGGLEAERSQEQREKRDLRRPAAAEL
jgi:carbon storage regulator